MTPRIRRCVATYQQDDRKMVRLDCGHSHTIDPGRAVPSTMVCRRCSDA